MPSTQVQASAIKSSAIQNASNRLNVSEVKRLIHDSGICLVAIKMAETGRRPVFNEKKNILEWEEMSEAAHVDMIKFVTNKVIPNAKEQETTEDKKALDAWAHVIEAEDAKELAEVS